MVRVPFVGDEPTGSHKNFLTGIWIEGDDRAAIRACPADVAFLPSGATLVADDTAGTIWHIAPSDAATDVTTTGSIDLSIGGAVPRPKAEPEDG